MPGAPNENDRPRHGWREVRHYAYVERPYYDVMALLARTPVTVLGGREAGAGGPEVPVSARKAGLVLSRDVRLRFGDLAGGEDRARLTLSWEDAHHPRLFPVLEATLELAPLRSGRRAVTQIGVAGRYRPPFGALGGLADRAAGQDVAEESVSDFVDGVARRLEALLPAPEEPAEGAVAPVRPGLRRVLMPVDGLAAYPGGAAWVGHYLEATPGVLSAEVHPSSGMATIEYDPMLCSPLKVLENLEDDRAWLQDMSG